MPNEWERMVISFALWLRWRWAGNQKCLCLFSKLIPWRSISATICWVPTRWWCWILSLEGFKGWEPRSIFSSLGLCLFSDWNWVAEVRQTYKLGNRLAWGCIYPQGIPNKNFNHNTTWSQNYYLFICLVKYDTGIQMWTKDRMLLIS